MRKRPFWPGVWKAQVEIMTTEQHMDEDAKPSAGDDMVLPFQAVRTGISGRLVRLGGVVDDILSRHQYPESVSRILGEAIAVTALLGVALKHQSKFIFQTKSDGPINFLVVNYEAPGAMRAYASFDREAIEALEAADEAKDEILLGYGHLAMTIDPGAGMDRYQGIVALEGESLLEAVDTYFKQSEQLPTFARVATARHYAAGDGEADGKYHWRAGGIIIQQLGDAGESATEYESDNDNAIPKSRGGDWDDDEDWGRTRILAETVQDHELLDPLLTPEKLLYSLFHEEGVRVFERKPMEVHCGCSKEKVRGILSQFSVEDMEDMVEPDGQITVTCEYCNLHYRFTPDELSE